MHFEASPEIFRRAKILRKNMTPSEKKLWDYLKVLENTGYKFRRQHPINHYIVDFYCHPIRLVIEVDGEIHEEPEMKQKDEFREAELETLGLKIIRFNNYDVNLYFEEVVVKINEYLNSSRD